MAIKKRETDSREDVPCGAGGFLAGLGKLLEKVGELAEKGGELRKEGQIPGSDGKLKGIYGFTIRTGLGDKGIAVEPFGNVRTDADTGKAEVHEVREPMVDVFEEPDHVLVVAEMPGVSEADVQLELKDDILSLRAEKGDKKYRKEVLLPRAFSAANMSHKCRNGVLEVKLTV